MDNFLLTLNIVLPVFLVMVVGYVCKAAGMILQIAEKTMNKLVFNVFLPVSLARSLMNIQEDSQLNPWVLGFCAAGVVATFLAALLVVPRVEKVNARRGVLIQGSFRSNYAIFGLPLAEALFPQGDGGVAAMMVIATIPVFNVLAVISLEFFRGGKCDFKRVALGVLKNPLIWGCAIGFLVSKLPFDLPDFALSTVNKLASVASPLALFVLGASIDLKKIRGNKGALLWGTGVRLVLVPAVLLTIAYFLGFRGAEFSALMIAFGSPCAVSSYTMAAQMGGDEDLAGQLVMATTVLCSVTMFLMIFCFKTWGIF